MTIKKFLLGALATLIIVITGVGMYIYFNANKIAEEIVRESLIQNYNESDDTKYIINLKDININIFDGSVDLLNITIVPKDSIVTYSRELDLKDIPNTSLYIYIHKISLLKFDYEQAISYRKIVVKKFEIIEPIIDIYQHIDMTELDAIEQDTVDFKSIFLTHYDTFKIGEVFIKDLTSSYYTISKDNDTQRVVSVNHISYKISNILANARTLNSAPYIEYDEFHLYSQNISATIKDKAEIKIGSINFESVTNKIDLLDFEFTPLIEAPEFFKSLKFRKAWIKLSADLISIDHINYESWIMDTQLIINRIDIINPILDVKTNSTIPFNPHDTKPMLGALLTNVPINYAVNTIHVEDAQINVLIRGKQSPKLGILNFSLMDIDAKNLNNIEDRIERNSIFDIKVNTKVNGTGNVEVNLKIDLSNSASQTAYYIHAQNLDLPKFNSVLEPSALVSIKSGKMISLKLSSTISSNGGRGMMDAHYTNLKLKILSKEKQKENNFMLNMVSGLANGYIRNNNIPSEPDYHRGPFTFTKAKTDSFFKMLWMCNLYGLEESIIGTNKKGRSSKEEKKSKKKKKRDLKKAKSK